MSEDITTCPCCGGDGYFYHDENPPSPWGEADALEALKRENEALRWNKTLDGLPKKPGKRDYEQIECLIMLPNGEIEISMWNCEHEVWDDAEGDDYRHDPCKPTHWLPLAPIRAALSGHTEKGGGNGQA